MGGQTSKISFLLCKGVTGGIHTNTGIEQVFNSSGSGYHRITESIKLQKASVIIESNLYTV